MVDKSPNTIDAPLEVKPSSALTAAVISANTLGDNTTTAPNISCNAIPQNSVRKRTFPLAPRKRPMPQAMKMNTANPIIECNRCIGVPCGICRGATVASAGSVAPITAPIE